MTGNSPHPIDAAVLLPLYGWPDEEPGLVFTERRADMRRHAGEISFPGGRRDPGDADLSATALREAQEEIGLDPAKVELGEELPPTNTFVTSYRIHPFVGHISHPRELNLQPNPTEVETVLTFSLAVLRESYEMRRRPQRRPHPHPDLRGRRAADLGSHRENPRRPLGAPRLEALRV